MDTLLRLLVLLLSPILAIGALLLLQAVGEGLTWLFSESKPSEEYLDKHHIPEDGRSWNSYGEYMGSETWAAKREAVLSRADQQCEIKGCDRKAEEAHHEEYPSKWGHETLNDLIAVCGPCHDELHPDKPDRHQSMGDIDDKLNELGL